MKSGGVPRFYINNTPIVTNSLFVNTDIWSPAIETQVRMAYENGVRLFSTICYLNPMQTDFNDSENVKAIYTARLKQITDIAKDAIVILRVDVGSYLSEFSETENEKDKTGTVFNRISMGSEKWAEKVVQGLSVLTKVIRTDKYACDHVAIIHLDFQEFFQRSFPDVSIANVESFTKWLKDKYVTNEAFAKAWGEDITFSSAYIPTNFSGERNEKSVYSTPSEQKCADYYDYISEITADRIDSFAKAIKMSCNSEIGVIAFYGYYFELLKPSSGHFAMENLLKSPYLDGFAAPVSYMERSSFVSTSAYMSVVDSVARNNKIWFQESDQRTSLAYDGVPTSDGLVLGGTEEIIKKHTYEHGMNLVHASGTWQMDLLSKGWLADEAIWQNIKYLDTFERAYIAATDKLPVFDILFVVDERAMRMYKDADIFYEYTEGLKQTAYRFGASVGLAQMNDVVNGKFKGTKLYIFLNPWALSADDSEKLTQTVKQAGVTSVFCYGFGDLTKEEIKNLTGMEINYSEKTRPFSVEVTAEGSELGFKTNLLAMRFLPRAVVEDGGSVVLGKYGTGEEVSFALCDKGAYKTIFRGSGFFSDSDLYALAQLAGVNVFSRSNDNLSANHNLIVSQAVSDGKKTLEFNRNLDVYDVFEKQWHESVSSYTFESKTGDVKWLLYGTKKRLEKYIGE